MIRLETLTALLQLLNLTVNFPQLDSTSAIPSKYQQYKTDSRMPVCIPIVWNKKWLIIQSKTLNTKHLSLAQNQSCTDFFKQKTLLS